MVTVSNQEQIRAGSSERQDVTGGWASVATLAGWVALIQLLCVLMTIVVVIAIGAEPTTAEEYYTVLGSDRLVGLLRLDFPTLVQLSLMPITAWGIFTVLRSTHAGWSSLATLLILFGTALGLSNHSALPMIFLSDQYAVASLGQHELLLAAGQALIAGDMYHSSAGFLAGLFMQGGFVWISALMLGSRSFSRATALSGMLANGLDLLHVLVGLVLPGVATALLFVGGLFYLAWFPLLGRDLLRSGRQLRGG